MKNLYFYIVFFNMLCSNYIFSQELITPPPFKTLEANYSIDGFELGETPGEVIPLNEEQTLYAIYFSPQFTDFPDNVPFYEAIMQGEYFRLNIIDNEVNKLHEWGTNTYNNDGNSLQSIVDLSVKEDTIYLLGRGYNDSISAERSYCVLTFDTTLTLIDSYWFERPVDNVYWSGISTTVKNKDGNYVMTGEVEDPTPDDPDATETFACEFSPQGDLLKYVAPLFFGYGINFNKGSIYQLENGWYAVDAYAILDEDLNAVASFEFPISLSKKFISLDSSKFIFGGTGRHILPGSGNDHNYEGIFTSDLSGNVDTIFYNSFPPLVLNSSYTRPGFRAFSVGDTNHIFLASRRKPSLWDQNAFVAMHSVAINGTPNWSYFFGGDVGYTPIDIVPLPDGGCILFVWTVFPNSDNTVFVSDLEYVYFDEAGNVDGISPSLERSGFERLPALIYPNPTSDFLYFEYGQQFQNLRITVTDAVGKEVFTQTIHNQEAVNVRHLSIGSYFYNLWDKDEMIQSGQFMIKR